MHNVDGHDWRFAWVDEPDFFAATQRGGEVYLTIRMEMVKAQIIAFDLFSTAAIVENFLQ